jgi:hypothetical protein
VISRAGLSTITLAIVSTAALWLASSAMADQSKAYQVTIKNLTGGQPLTPPVVATHRGKNQLFRVGQPASVGVREIAENGNNAPLLALLAANPFGRISESKQAGEGPLVPAGKPGAAQFPDHVKFSIGADRGARRLSFVSMLVCTNDGFTGVNGLRLPRRVGRSVVAHTAGYDAHTERNTEDLADIVPPCQGLIGVSSGEPGTATSDPALAEGGLIAHHEGIQGGSDLRPGVHGWTDPVARIRVERTR